MAIGRSTKSVPPISRSEEHTSELQSRPHLVCRLLLEKKRQGRAQARPCGHGRAGAQRRQVDARVLPVFRAGKTPTLGAPPLTPRGFEVFFFFNDTATTETNPLSPHEPLPI